jgi:hypothetical protein
LIVTAFWAGDVEVGELLTQHEAVELVCELAELEPLVGLPTAGVLIAFGADHSELVIMRPELELDGERLFRVLEVSA